MLEEDCTYHVYNRANGSENLFREPNNYRYFLKKYAQHVSPVTETFVYCLLPNHFHAMVRVRTQQEINSMPVKPKTYDKWRQMEKMDYGLFVSKQFSNFFNSYTQSYNKVYNRTGSLFQPNMKKKEVTSDSYYTDLILYIHNNAVRHGFVKQAKEWPYSSYGLYVNNGEATHEGMKVVESPTVEKVISWFGNREEFERAHAVWKQTFGEFDDN